METPSTSSGEGELERAVKLRPTSDLTERERENIRKSELPYKTLARMFSVKESQIRYVRSTEGRQAERQERAWSEEEEGMLEDLYSRKGWAPRAIANHFPTKTYTQVYRKMQREFKGR